MRPVAAVPEVMMDLRTSASLFLPANLIMGAFSLGLSERIVLRFGIRAPLAIGMFLVAGRRDIVEPGAPRRDERGAAE
jgi:hypothetical protein